MSTWIVGRHLTKQKCRQKKNFTVIQTWKILQMLIINTQKMFGGILNQKI